MYVNVQVSPLHRGDIMSRSTEKWISGSGRSETVSTLIWLWFAARIYLWIVMAARGWETRGRELWRGEGRTYGRVDGGDTGWLKVERPGWRGGPGENIMFPTARGVVYFMIWRAIWHLARGIIHARAARACVCVNRSSSSLRAVSRVAGSGCARVCILNTRAHARMKNHRPTHACAHTYSARDRYALRPSTSKPEIEALRKYNADWRNLPFSVCRRTDGMYTHAPTCTKSGRRDAKEMKSREWRKKKGTRWTNASEKERRMAKGREERTTFTASHLIYTTHTWPFLFYFILRYCIINANQAFMVFQPQLYALV